MYKRFRLLQTDARFNIIKEQTDFVSFKAIFNMNDISRMTITLDYNQGINITYNSGFILTYGDEIDSSKFLGYFFVRGFTHTYNDNEDTITLDCADVLDILGRALAHPAPSQTLAGPDVIESLYEQSYDTQPPVAWTVTEIQDTNNKESHSDFARASDYTGLYDYRYRVKITSTGTNDGFKWYKRNLEEEPVTPVWSDEVSITSTDYIPLDDSVYVKFDYVTGHALDDRWDVYVYRDTWTQEALLRHYVDVNVGPNAYAYRQYTPPAPPLIPVSTNPIMDNQGLSYIPENPVYQVLDTSTCGLVLETIHSPELGEGKRISARFNNLLELCQEIATPPTTSGKEVRFYIDKEPDSSVLTFKVADIVDKTSLQNTNPAIILSTGTGNIKSYTYSTSPSTGNYIYVGGKGEEGNRIFYEFLDTYSSESIMRYGMIEKFIDKSNLDNVTDMYYEAIVELGNSMDKTNLTVVPFDIEGASVITDYWIGDKVTVVIDNKIIHEVVRAVDIDVTRDEIKIIPTIGTSDTRRNAILKLFDSNRKLAKRIGKRERA